MALDLNKFKQGIKKSAENIRETASNVSEKMSESVSNMNVSDSMKDLAQKGKSAFGNLKDIGMGALSKQHDKQIQRKAELADALQTDDSGEHMLSFKDALRLIYSLIIIDGHIDDEENARFQDIGKHLDPYFISYQDELMKEGKRLLNTTAEDEDDYYDIIHDHVSGIIQSAVVEPKKAIRGKVLLWDLLSVAYSEKEYSPSEKRLLRYIAKCMGVDAALLLEMEHTLRTLIAVETEEKWLKNSDKPYAIVEERVNELADRKEAIMHGVYDLLAD